MSFQSFAFQRAAFQQPIGIVVTATAAPKGGIHPWYAEEYHRVRLRQQKAKLQELNEEIAENVRFTEEIVAELAEARLQADKVRLTTLEKTYKEELTTLLQTIIQIKAAIRESEELLVMAIALRRRLKVGMFA